MTSPPGSSGVPLLGRLEGATGPPSDLTELENEVVGLFDQMRERMLRYILGFGLPIGDAEEIVQDVFLALCQHLVRGKSRASLCAWIFRVAHNLSLKRRIIISRMPANPAAVDVEGHAFEVVDPAPNPEDRLAFRQRQHRLRSVLNVLPETDRQCLCLRAEGLRYREISDVLGISVGGVANSLARSLARLSAVDERRR